MTANGEMENGMMSDVPLEVCPETVSSRVLRAVRRLWAWRPFRKHENNLTSFAETELRTAGLFDADSDYGGMIGEAVTELVNVFSKQGHSGFSAHLCLDVFAKVAAFKPLGPLTGEDSEWHEVTDGIYQNNRCSRVFRENGAAYDSEGVIWRDPDGLTSTNFESRVPVTFPYTPSQRVVDRSVGTEQ